VTLSGSVYAARVFVRERRLRPIISRRPAEPKDGGPDGHKQVMDYELDHVFLFTEAGAPAAARLVQCGLSEGEPNTHPGQGTCNRRFFFHNSFLELLWVDNPAETQSTAVRPTYLWERWAGRADGANPFGLVFRAAKDVAAAPPPFATWQYRPPYLPEPLCIEVGQNAAILAEPALFYLSFGRRSDSFPTTRLQPINHAAGARELTRVHLVGPATGALSPELQKVADLGLISVEPGEKPCLELGFDHKTSGQRIDFRPALPLICCW